MNHHHSTANGTPWAARFRDGLVLSLILSLVFAGCMSTPTDDGPIPGQKEPPVPTGSSLSSLQFENEDIGKLLKAIDEHMRKHAADGNPWKHIPWGQGGNFFRARWARGAGARDDCIIASGTGNERDQHAIEVYTLFYPQNFPQVFGYGINILQTPSATGWGVSFYLAEEGKTVVGPGFSLTFRHYEKKDGSAGKTISLGTSSSHTVVATQVRHQSEHSPREECRLYLVSATSFRDRAMASLQALEKACLAKLAAHEVQFMEYGAYEGNGIPPEERPRPLTAEEEKKALAETTAHFAAQRQLIAKEFETLYKVAVAAVPFIEQLR